MWVFEKPINRWPAPFFVARGGFFPAAARLRAVLLTWLLLVLFSRRASHRPTQQPFVTTRPRSTTNRHLGGASEMFSDEALDSFLDATANLVRLVVLRDQAGAALRSQTKGKAKAGKAEQTPEMTKYLELVGEVSGKFKYAVENGCPMSLVRENLQHFPQEMILDILA